MILLVDQHVGVLKIKSLFCFLLISGKQVNLSTPLRSDPTWAYMGCNWHELTGVNFDERQQEKKLVMVTYKMDKFEGKKW